MTPDHRNSEALAFAMWLNGAALPDTDRDGRVLADDTLLIFFNASWNPQVFTLPPPGLGSARVTVLDTAQATGSAAPQVTALRAGAACSLDARSLLMLRRAE